MIAYRRNRDGSHASVGMSDWSIQYFEVFEEEYACNKIVNKTVGEWDISTGKKTMRVIDRLKKNIYHCIPPYFILLQIETNMVK